jgi:hypothetical protein
MRVPFLRRQRDKKGAVSSPCLKVPPSTLQKHKSWRRADQRTSGHLASFAQKTRLFLDEASMRVSAKSIIRTQYKFILYPPNKG